MTGIDTMYKQIWPSSASYLDVIQKYTGKNTKKNTVFTAKAAYLITSRD